MLNKLCLYALVAIGGGTGYSWLATSGEAVRPPPHLKVSDLRLAQSMRLVVPFVPNPANAIVVQPQLPAGTGIAITEIGGLPNVCSVRLRIQVNGDDRASLRLPAAESHLSRYEFNPPIIVRPGDTLTLTFPASGGGSGPPCYLGNGLDLPEFSIGGWKLEPGDA